MRKQQTNGIDTSSAIPAHGKYVRQNRQVSLNKIRAALQPNLQGESKEALLALGDSLELLKRFPSESVSLILTDPPYHVTRKKNIVNDTAFASDDEYINWVEQLVGEWRRILRPNGSVYCFCDAAIAYRVEATFCRDYNLLSHIVWTKPNDPGYDGWKQKMKKEALRQWYSYTERVIFAEPGFEGNLGRSYLGLLLREMRKQSGLSSNKLTELTGAYGKVNHGGAVSNWETGRNVPSRDQYTKICDAFFATGRVNEMPAYEDVVRPFFTSSSVEFTDVWNFPSVRPYKGKHPAEKPLGLLEHVIQTSSFEGDLVLDCFSGSGNTARAALNLKRRAIAVDIDPHWVEQAKQRIFGLEKIAEAPITVPAKAAE